MDKKTFFSLLTDEAAKPDTAFIASLREQVVKIAAGGPPPSSGFSPTTPQIIAAITVGAALMTSLTFGVRSSTPEPEFPAAVVASVEDEDSQVLSDTQEDQPEEPQDDEPIETSVITEDEDDEPTTPVTPTPDPTPTPLPNPIIPLPPTLDETFTVNFWSVSSFVAGEVPIIPSTPADYTETGVENIFYDWGENAPDASVTKNHFVARATATKALGAGKYDININADDAIRIFIDGNIIYNKWEINNGGIIDKVSFTVPAGSETTKVVIEYFEHEDKAQLVADIVKQ